MSEEGLEKVHIDLPNHWAMGGESLWAKPLGHDLYQIENVPFFAYGLNYHDIVHAKPQAEDYIPEILKVVTPSGHSTLRIIFEKEIENEKQVELLNILENHGASYERATETDISIDISASGDYNAVYDYFQELEDTGLLSFETCEPRAENSFDDAPED